MPKKNFIINNSEIGLRLESFIEILGIKKKDFASMLEVPASRITDLITGRITIYDYSQKLYSFGCNINWLISGNEEIFAENEAGRILKEKIEGKPKSNVEEVSTSSFQQVPVITTKEQIQEILREVINENR